jgi:hypothetical protein
MLHAQLSKFAAAVSCKLLAYKASRLQLQHQFSRVPALLLLVALLLVLSASEFNCFLVCDVLLLV